MGPCRRTTDNHRSCEHPHKEHHTEYKQGLRKGKDRARADKGKRPAADDNGNSSVLKRSRDEAGPSGWPCSSHEHAALYPCMRKGSHSTFLAISFCAAWPSSQLCWQRSLVCSDAKTEAGASPCTRLFAWAAFQQPGDVTSDMVRQLLLDE